MSINSVHNNRTAGVGRGPEVGHHAAVSAHAGNMAPAHHYGASHVARKDDVSISSRANHLSFEAPKAASKSEVSSEVSPEKAGASKLTASDYEEGSDVREMAYTMAAEGKREDVDLDDYTVLRATEGNDTINISKNGSGLKVTIGEEEYEFTAEEAKNLIIDGSKGDDSIVADTDVYSSLHIVGGEGKDNITGGSGKDFIYDNYGSNNIKGGDGNDTIIANQRDYKEGQEGQKVTDDRGFFQKLWDRVTGKPDPEEYAVEGNVIDGGEGRDYIEGGLGQDKIDGGKGNDVIYGLNGNDIINGGDGNDYIDGGKGDDTIKGGKGDNMLFGGRGNDAITAEDGNNVIVGGRGVDTITAGDGKNRVTSDSKDGAVDAGKNGSIEYVDSSNIPSNISISGDEGYTERVQSDLDSLAATTTGQQMLNALGDTGKNITIQSTDGGNYCSYYTNGVLKDDGTANVGSDSTVAYNRYRSNIGSASWGERPPIVGMYHEMAHAYDAGKGILDGRYFNYDGTPASEGDAGSVKAAELQSVGLNVTGDVNLNPEGVSENDLRSFLGLERRDKY